MKSPNGEWTEWMYVCMYVMLAPARVNHVRFMFRCGWFCKIYNRFRGFKNNPENIAQSKFNRLDTNSGVNSGRRGRSGPGISSSSLPLSLKISIMISRILPFTRHPHSPRQLRESYIAFNFDVLQASSKAERFSAVLSWPLANWTENTIATVQD